MTLSLSRRRFLTISAAVAAVGSTPANAASESAHWRGVALGASARMEIVGMAQVDAGPLFATVETELSRLENVFSLYRDTSELSRLNRDGYLDAPSLEMVEILSLADRIHAASGGAFDPSVQPLWQAHATGGNIAEARARVGWDQVEISPARINLGRKGGALTLNGIAQGYVSDRIAGLLRGHGLRNVLVDMGEIVALGQAGPQRDWTVGIAGQGGQVVARVALSDQALATSSPSGMRMGGNGLLHILSPIGGHVDAARVVSVAAPSAAVADGLSTACCLLERGAAEASIATFPEARLVHWT
ncbi:FAD:protein FMN transferase [Shimia biformata]|uniref:FAD:protein FMN transferase n=1 Tax=Shimia biformata TaxID=1294299 RepID=UPI001EF1F83D|nr:FAD:protein FMN transferase [Shimia biformata]